MKDKVEKFIFTLVLISVIGATTVVVKTILECMESVAWKKEKINVNLRVNNVVDDNTLNFIKDFEKLHLHSYRCSGGKWSIGYGSTLYKGGINVKHNEVITESSANELLEYHLNKIVVKCINDNVKVELNKNMFDAICSLIYNIGDEAFIKSTLLVKLNNMDYIGASEEILKWDKVTINKKKVKSNGLTMRREKEKELFLKGVKIDL